LVGGSPEYPVEETDKLEIVDECESVASECDTFSVTVCSLVSI